MQRKLERILQKPLAKSSNEEIYFALLTLVKQLTKRKKNVPHDRTLYYFSSEFLIGKLLSNNLLALNIYDEVNEVLTAHGIPLSSIESIEPEPSLGNGGLGRLSACFMDSIANLGLPGEGVGLLYHFGLFKQMFKDHKQLECPNPWLSKESWVNDGKFACDVQFATGKVRAKMYNINIVGETIAPLHLFDITTVDEQILNDGISFDKTKIDKNLTLFLYPDDSDIQGHLLRIYQQYFMVSAGAQYLLRQMENKGQDLNEISKHVVIQINDTHPSMVIPELIRLLVEKGVPQERAIEEIAKTCAYTNHTILAEALETWPLSYIEQVAPQLIPILRALDQKVKTFCKEEALQIIDRNDVVHMAHLDIHYCYSVNGVAALHTEILKNSELKPFYDLYPSKFNNKTNGITFRRWLRQANPSLAGWIAEKLGEDAALLYTTAPTVLAQLAPLAEDKKAQNEFLAIKKKNKEELKMFLKRTQNITVNARSIFDIQIKRLHEYKRQQMNFLYLVHKYLEIKKGILPKTPITSIFGAKAAPAYTIAKDIIHAILCLQNIIEKDKTVKKHLQVVMIENYAVTAAEKLIPACDVSEQISLASKEASGTGNMKFMLNGAVTLGTLDGANVEIAELVGDDNIYVFGKTSDEVLALYENRSYCEKDFYIQNPNIKELVDFLISPEMLEIGQAQMLLRLHADLIQKDWFMCLLDLEEYIKVKDQCFADYEDKEAWAKKMILNTANAGFFSSDRTIAQYDEDIWHLT